MNPTVISDGFPYDIPWSAVRNTGPDIKEKQAEVEVSSIGCLFNVCYLNANLSRIVYR